MILLYSFRGSLHIQEYRRLAKDKQKGTDNLFSPSTTKDEYAFQ